MTICHKTLHTVAFYIDFCKWICYHLGRGGYTEDMSMKNAIPFVLFDEQHKLNVVQIQL